MTKPRATSSVLDRERDTRRTTRPFAGLTDRTMTEQLDLSGQVGEVLRHRAELQPLIDCESSEEWSV